MWKTRKAQQSLIKTVREIRKQHRLPHMDPREKSLTKKQGLLHTERKRNGGSLLRTEKLLFFAPERPRAL